MVSANAAVARSKITSLTSWPVRYSGLATRPRMAPASSACRELANLDSRELRRFFDSFDYVMADCDGVLWANNEGMAVTGSTALPGAAEAIQKFRQMGKRVFFCTNNSTKSRSDYVEKCQKLGFGGNIDEIIGTGYLTARYLTTLGFAGKAYVLGTQGLKKELDDVGIDSSGYGPDPVPQDWTNDASHAVLKSIDPELNCVICGFDPHISFFKMAKAATILTRPNSIFVGTNMDEQFPVKGNMVIPGTGSMVRAVATAADREPVVMGKPSKMMFETIRQMCPEMLPPKTIMIGDRANTDILLGKNCNLQTLMVGTGVHSLEDIRRWEQSDDPEDKRLIADYYVHGLNDLLPLIEKAYLE